MPKANLPERRPRAGDIVNGKKLLPGSGAPGPGRRPGSPNKRMNRSRQAAKDILQRILSEGPTPLEVMWQLLRGYKTIRGYQITDLMLEAAKAAAPYVHPKLSSIELSGRLGITHEEALARLDRLDNDDEEPEDVPYEVMPGSNSDNEDESSAA